MTKAVASIKSRALLTQMKNNLKEENPLSTINNIRKRIITDSMDLLPQALHKEV